MRVESDATALYRGAADRFVTIANEFLERLARAQPELGEVSHPLDRELDFRVRRRFFQHEHLHLTGRSPLDWLADRFRSDPEIHRAAERRAERYVRRRSARTNASRVQNDLLRRFLGSRERLEREIERRLGTRCSARRSARWTGPAPSSRAAPQRATGSWRGSRRSVSARWRSRRPSSPPTAEPGVLVFAAGSPTHRRARPGSPGYLRRSRPERPRRNPASTASAPAPNPPTPPEPSPGARLDAASATWGPAHASGVAGSQSSSRPLPGISTAPGRTAGLVSSQSAPPNALVGGRAVVVRAIRN